LGDTSPNLHNLEKIPKNTPFGQGGQGKFIKFCPKFGVSRVLTLAPKKPILPKISVF
jgi:hypothetical protein